ncbi:MAG: hypothetical protein IT434_01680 [Phycisphaerales bacterium]|jgi:putative aminopeptidase FrvX|nr:hypothetical protein [Phycisphaerales bacterium]
MSDAASVQDPIKAASFVLTAPGLGFEIGPEARERHLRWLLELTQIPTAAGREFRVVAWLHEWLAARPGLEITTDPAGNIHVAIKARSGKGDGTRPVHFTAHLDHPAFVVERVIAPSVVELSFRGGVMEDYFRDAAIALYESHDARDASDARPPHASQTARDAHCAGALKAPLKGKLTGKLNEARKGDGSPSPFSHYLAELERASGSVAPGDVATWDLPAATIEDALVHTHACDDLAALAAALCAFDELLSRDIGGDVRLLFTRAEEVGFIGAIAACRPPRDQRLMPMHARVIALENSRSFAESPIGGGPIVRVGDRVSVFSPQLTDAIAKRAEEIAGAPSTVTASQKNSALPKWHWQRKLMAGGACEASVFCEAGYEATCVCLPLGNYHNMADLANVQAGTNTTPAKVGREFISAHDYHALVDLLIACGVSLPSGSPVTALAAKLWNDRSWVLNG